MSSKKTVSNREKDRGEDNSIFCFFSLDNVQHVASLASCSVSGNRKKKIVLSTNVDKVVMNNRIFSISLILFYYFKYE